MDDGTDRSKTTFLRLQELPHLASDEESASNHHRVLISSGSVSSEISLRIPFDQSDESELKWLLEEYPQTPFSLLRAKEVTKTLDWYMKNLATQVEDSGIFSRLGDLEVSGTLEIRVEALEDQQNESHGCLQAIHWEVLEDRRAWSTHVLKFETIQVLRIVQPLQDGPNCDVQMSQDSIRILFVCARHSLDDSEDISSRLLMDPIFEIIDEAKSKGRNTTAEVLRLGSFDAFTETLGNHPPAYFSAVHFDCHGWVSNETAHLDFVRVSGETHSVSALEVASCLRKAGVSVANLNACSSAATGAGSDSNLALCFTRSGISMTIAMSYDILDAASSVFEQEFYKFWLLDGVKDPDKKSKFSRFGKSQPILPNKVTLNESVCRAVQKARKAMRERDNRVGAGGWEVNLKDHIVPVIYAAKSKPSAELDDPSPSSTTQPHSSDLEPGPERKKWLKKIRSSISNIPVRPRNETMPSLQPEYRLPAKKIQKLKNTETMYSSLQPKGFRFNYIDPPIIGRDRAVAEIEAAVVQSHRKVTFIEGRAGSGKSILVRHICDWWKSTCYIEDFFYFDCRRYAILEESHDYSRDINGPCTAETQDMMQLVEHFLFSSMFPDEVSNSLFRLKGTTKEQKKKTRDKLRSGRYLLVFDNADFRMHEKDGMMTPMKALTIGSLLMCRDSAMKSATAVASIQSFIRDIHTGNSLVIVSARYKKWYQDYLPDVEAVMYSIPKLTLSSCLTIGERKLQQIRASDELCNYPGSTEDFAFLIDVLQNNPLAIELVYSSIIRKQLKPNAAYIQLCTEAMELDEKDALMAYAGAGRFVTELKAMANLDWHNGADESRLPFSMFWMADHAGYLPTEDGGIYWYTVIRRFYEMTRLLNTDWGNLTDPYGLNLGSNEEEIKNSILQPHSEQDIKRIVELIRVPDQALRLCRLMADLGLVEEEQNSDFIQVSTMAVLAQSKFLVHPLFPLIARGGCFGDSDTIHVQNLQMQRHTIFLRYTLTRYQFLFYKQFSGGQSSVADYATGKSQNLDLIGSATKKLLETASNELPSLLATLSWIVNSPAETTEAMIIISKSLTGIISPLGQLWRTRREMVVPFSEVLGKVFKRFLVFLQENSDPPDALLVKFTVQQAIRLAGMSSYRTGSPSGRSSFLEHCFCLSMTHDSRDILPHPSCSLILQAVLTLIALFFSHYVSGSSKEPHRTISKSSRKTCSGNAIGSIRS